MAFQDVSGTTCEPERELEPHLGAVPYRSTANTPQTRNPAGGDGSDAQTKKSCVFQLLVLC